MCVAKILSVIAGGAINTIAGDLEKAYAAKLNAQNDAERIDADKTIADLEAKKAVLVADAAAGDRTDSLVRGLLVSPVIVLLWKVFVYDLALGEWTHGHTDPIPAAMWTLVTWMIAFYFAHSLLKRSP